MKTTIVLAVLLPAVYYSQVGVNTPNPQAAFHVDGGKDNAISGAPTTLQQSNDLALSNLGRVGIGIANPAARLHLYNHIAGSDINDDYIFDDESPIAPNSQVFLMRRSNAGTNLLNGNIIGSILFNAKVNGSFSYSGAGIMGIHRGNGINQNNALAFLINSSNEAGRFDEFGNLGIGVTAPKNLLHLGGAVGSSVTDVAGKKLAVFNNSTGDDFYGLGLSSGFLQFHASSTPAEAPGMVLTSGGRVGINLGTTSPAANLDVAGNVKITDGTQGAGKILVSDANGLASWQNASTASTNIYNADGSLTGNRTVTQAGYPITFTGGSSFNVRPAIPLLQPLDPDPTLSIIASSENPMTKSPRLFTAAGLELQSNSNQGVMVLNGLNSLANTDPVFRVAFGNLNHTPGYTEYLRVQGNGNVGIGTQTPAAKLDVAGKIKIKDGTEAVGRVLTSDANGLASWNEPLFDSSKNYTPYMIAFGGSNIVWNNNAGWTDSSPAVPLILDEFTDADNVYNTSTGEVTITKTGAYLILAQVEFLNPPSTSNPGFNGLSGELGFTITLTPHSTSASTIIAGSSHRALRGVSSGSSLPLRYQLSGNTMLILNPGDKIRLNFATHGAIDMNNDPSKLSVNRNDSLFAIYKLN